MATHVDEIAKVYARSLFELASAGGESRVGEVGDQLEAVAELARGDAQLREFFASPIVDGAARGDALKRIFDGRVDDLLYRFLMVLNDHGRMGHLLQVADAFDLLVQERFGRVEVDVFTVSGGRLEGAVETSVKQRIKETFAKEAVLHSYADPHMIGGIKLRIGDQLIDGSVATRLRRMRAALTERGTADLGRSTSEMNRFLA